MRVLSLTLAVLVLLQLLLTAAILAVGVPPETDGAATIENVSAAVDLLVGLSPERRERAAAALSSPAMDVRLYPPGAPAPSVTLAKSEALAERFMRYLPGLEFSIYVEPRADQDHVELAGGPYAAAIPPFQLVADTPDGHTITLHARAQEQRGALIRAASSLNALLSTFILILVLFAAGLRLRPLRRMTDRARSLADDPEAPAPAAASSPGSMRELAEALDRIQATLRGLVAERTFILASIAHDMRTHLSRLRMRIDGLAETEDRERMIDDITTMNRLIEDTLLYARADHQRDEPEELCLADLTQDVVQGHRELNQTVALAIPRSLRERVIQSHPEAIARALSNLIDNAIRYAGAAEVVLSEEHGCLRLDVLDEGPGVPDEALARLTAPYHRVETSRSRATGGSGLGLAIVASLVRAAGAKLELDNRPTRGFRATLRFVDRTG